MRPLNASGWGPWMHRYEAPECIGTENAPSSSCLHTLPEDSARTCPELKHNAGLIFSSLWRVELSGEPLTSTLWLVLFFYLKLHINVQKLIYVERLSENLPSRLFFHLWAQVWGFKAQVKIILPEQEEETQQKQILCLYKSDGAVCPDQLSEQLELILFHLTPVQVLKGLEKKHQAAFHPC